MFPRWLVLSGTLGFYAIAHAHPSLERHHVDYIPELRSSDYHATLNLDDTTTSTVATTNIPPNTQRDLEPLDWRTLTCPDNYVLSLTEPAELWRELRGDEAWNEMVTAWTNRDGTSWQNSSFPEFLGWFFHRESVGYCGFVDSLSICAMPRCLWFEEKNGTGPAGYLISRAVQRFHFWFKEQHRAVVGSMLGGYRWTEDAFGGDEGFEKEFVNFMAEKAMAVGMTMGMAPAFYNLTTRADSEAATRGSEEGLKHLLSIAAATSKDVGFFWPAPSTSHKYYKDYLLRDATANIQTAIAGLERGIFSGDDTSIALLSYMVADGKMWGIDYEDRNESATKNAWQTAKYGILIGHMWRLSNITPVILDTGAACTEKEVGVGDYIWSMNVANATGCVDGKLYYLVSPEGRPKSYDAGMWLDRKFSALKGVDRIVAGRWDGVTIQDMITSAVTFSKKHGNRKSYEDRSRDVAFSGTWEEFFEVVKSTKSNMGSMVSAPGVIDIPVCSPEEAWKNWLRHHGDKTPRYYQYPCDRVE